MIPLDPFTLFLLWVFWPKSKKESAPSLKTPQAPPQISPYPGKIVVVKESA